MTEYFGDGEKRYKVQIRYNFLKKKIEIHITYLKFIKFFDKGLLEDKIEVTFCNAFSLKMQRSNFIIFKIVNFHFKHNALDGFANEQYTIYLKCFERFNPTTRLD